MYLVNLILCIDVSYGSLYLNKSTEYDFILSRYNVKCTYYYMKATKGFGQSTQYFIDLPIVMLYISINYYVKVTFYITRICYYHIIYTSYCVLCTNYLHTYLKTVMAFHTKHS